MESLRDLDFSNAPKEMRLLTALLKIENNKHNWIEIKALCQDADWKTFLQLARHHRVYPQLYAILKEQSFPSMPGEIVASLKRDYEQNTFKMLYLTAETERIYAALMEDGVRTIVLKGSVLGHELYGDISKRTSGDLDVLIPLEQLERAERILLRFGYDKDDYIESVLNDWRWRHHHVSYIHPETKTKVELHWRLHPAPSKEPGFGQLWERRVSSKVTRYPVAMLGNEDLFLYLIVHGARHGWSRIRWLVDIAQICKRGVNWSQLQKRLSLLGETFLIGQSLLLAANMLGMPVSEPMEPYIHNARSRRHAKEALFYVERMINLHSPPLPEDVEAYHRRHLVSIMSFRQKCLYFLSMLHPYPTDAKLLPLPKSLHLLYFPLRPFLLLWRRTKKQDPSIGGL